MPLVVGSPVATALYEILNGEPVVRLTPTDGIDPLQDVAEVLARLVALCKSQTKVLFPVAELDQELQVMDELCERLRQMQCWSYRFGTSDQMANILDDNHPGGGHLTLQCRAVLPTRRGVPVSHLLIVDPRWAPTMLQPPLDVHAGQVLIVSRSTAPATPEMLAVLEGSPAQFWAAPPVDVVLAGAVAMSRAPYCRVFAPPPLVVGSPVAQATFAVLSGEHVVEYPESLKAEPVTLLLRSVLREQFENVVVIPGDNRTAAELAKEMAMSAGKAGWRLEATFWDPRRHRVQSDYDQVHSNRSRVSVAAPDMSPISWRRRNQVIHRLIVTDRAGLKAMGASGRDAAGMQIVVCTDSKPLNAKQWTAVEGARGLLPNRSWNLPVEVILAGSPR